MKHYYMMIKHQIGITNDYIWTAEHESANTFQEAVNAIDESDAASNYKVLKAILVKETDNKDNRLYSRLVNITIKTNEPERYINKLYRRKKP